MLWVLILFISGGTYSLKSTPNDRFFEKLFTPILFTLRVFARNLLRGNRRRNTFRISFWCLAWDSNSALSSNKPTHYLLDHGDFAEFIDCKIGKTSFWWIIEQPLHCHLRKKYCTVTSTAQNYQLKIKFFKGIQKIFPRYGFASWAVV